MKTAQKMLFIPMIIAALTAYGMEATALSERNPSPVATIGATPETPVAFVAYGALERLTGHSDVKLGLQFQQLIALFDPDTAPLVRCGAGDFFLDTANSRIELGRVEIREVDRLVGEDGEAGRPGLGKAARHEEPEFFGRRFVDNDNTRLHARNQRRVVLKDREFALRPWNDHGFDLS
jgi:hypothetical protein